MARSWEAIMASNDDSSEWSLLVSMMKGRKASMHKCVGLMDILFTVIVGFFYVFA